MGTVFSLDVRGGAPDRIAAAVEGAAAWLRHVDEVFSTYRPGSQISRLAAGGLTLARCSAEVREVHRLCEDARRRTGGWFSAAYAGGFDPTGLVKGWAVERAAEMLRSAGADAVCVNGGGDVQTFGGPWRIGVADPLRPGAVAAVVRAGEGAGGTAHGDGLAVATSGPAERGGHVLDPHTGRPPRDALASLTVVSRTLTEADVAATAAYAMGARARGWLAAEPGTEAFAVTAGGRTWHTAGFGALADPPAGRTPGR
ncbi:FAD:protein FMN transferase [Streptomyces sp. V4-01]|uniref:FAD:protein FMN transferase n=1 Tax=Actinacidiphila polyblastidii TaxID=3110430 RepID=A0ABU7PIV1_9ACTN|nr:FAD:protein FMN transferase [Streptomyces sp. V4-01]